jgi:hypothetical protein
MKRVVAKYVALCDNCQGVKAERQRPTGLLQLLKIPQWKWEEISMDFIVGLPSTQSGYDSIWVIVDRFLKVAQFIPVNTTYKGAKLVELYIGRIVCLHGVPKKIVMFKGPMLLRTQCRLNGSVMLVEKEVTMPTSAPIRVHALLRQLCLHLPRLMEPTLFLLLLTRTMLMGESTTLSWRKPRKLLILPLVCFPSMTLL